ncbi:MAG TPA: hypothetical protein VNB49_10795, partial [Candidatus Dormibacteraeota bacterium]|nr:hypothetical protein [Candidatus Dormibacteraeota bacterium]
MKFHWSVITKIAACSLLISGGLAHAQDPQLVPVLQGLLQKYQRCILEEYENQVDENDGNKTNPRALGPKRDAATCVAGNVCTRASRQDMYNRLKAQADRGDPTNFEANLEQAILNDCSWCAKHNEFHTKLMHCTLECNGNQNWQANPFKFDAKVGPCFEVCKAGVDIEKAVNDVKNDIQHFLHGAIETFLPAVNLQGYELTQATSQATGGPSILTNRIIVDPGPAEECQSRVSPLGYVVPPADLLDWSATEALPFRKDETNYVPLPPPTRDRYEPQALGNPEIQLAIGANEGRLRPDLRQAAAQANPVGSLCLAAAAYALGNKLDANAFADLSVTGRRTFEAFRQRLPKDADILACLRKNPRTQALPADKLQDATKTVLNRAYRVLGVLRTGGWPGTKDDPACSSDRGPLGYIAVSGEDDQPHRPVNVPSAEFPQYDLDVP